MSVKRDAACGSTRGCRAHPGDLVSLDSFYIGHLKGVGKIYQLPAVDTATRWAVMLLMLGPPDGRQPTSSITPSGASQGWGSQSGPCLTSNPGQEALDPSAHEGSLRTEPPGVGIHHHGPPIGPLR